MSIRRTAAAVAVPLLLLTVTACEKPVPQVTVATGGRVVNIDPSRYCHKSDDCKTHSAAKATLPVRLADQISINVPAHVAHEGWYLRIDGKPLQGYSKPRKKLHHTLPIPGALTNEIEIEIVQGTEGGEPQGIWTLTLSPRI